MTITFGQTLENPITGERFTFTHTAASPGGAVPIPHVHPSQTERFEVLDGRVQLAPLVCSAHRPRVNPGPVFA